MTSIVRRPPSGKSDSVRLRCDALRLRCVAMRLRCDAMRCEAVRACVEERIWWLSFQMSCGGGGGGDGVPWPPPVYENH